VWPGLAGRPTMKQIVVVDASSGRRAPAEGLGQPCGGRTRAERSARTFMLAKNTEFIRTDSP